MARKEYDRDGDDSSYDGTTGGRPVLYASVAWTFPALQTESGLEGFDVVLHSGTNPDTAANRIGQVYRIKDPTALDCVLKIPSKKTGTATVNASVRAVYTFGNGPWATSGVTATQTTGTVVVPGISSTATLAAPTANGLVIGGGGTTIALASASGTTPGAIDNDNQSLGGAGKTKTLIGTWDFSSATVTGVSAGITQLTGDVTAGPGSGSQAATVATHAVSNSKLAQMASNTVKANLTGVTADPSDATLSSLGSALGPYITVGSIPPSSVTFSPADSMIFGTGEDGDLASGFGTKDLTTGSGFTYGTKNYHNVTLGSGDKIKFYGWHLFISGTLDISAADAGAISMSVGASGNGSAGSASSGGTQGVPLSTSGGNLGQGSGGSAGGSGATGTGNGASGGNVSTPANGGSGGTGGTGGTGTGGNTGGFTLTGAARSPMSLGPLDPYIGMRIVNGSPTVINGGAGAGGGSGGGGDGTNLGGGGGGGGASGGVLAIFANNIVYGSNTNAVFSVAGGNGGNGATQSTGNVGGGGGGAGGGGGVGIIGFKTKSGTIKFDISGGTGGNGGNGAGTGTGGNGGDSGGTGMLYIFDMNNGITIISPTAPVSGGAHSGATGGTGASNTSVISI